MHGKSFFGHENRNMRFGIFERSFFQMLLLMQLGLSAIDASAQERLKTSLRITFMLVESYMETPKDLPVLNIAMLRRPNSTPLRQRFTWAGDLGKTNMLNLTFGH